MVYTRVGFELTIEQGFQSTVNYVQSTVNYVQSTARSFRKSVLYLLDITCNDDCDRWCAVDDCSPPSRSSEPPLPNRIPEPEVDASAYDDDAVQMLPVGETEAPTSHRKTCWDAEEEETQCLNGGSCFAIELHNGMRRSGCSCGPRWTGERCEMRYVDPSLWADSYDSSYRSASISVEIGLLVIASFLLLSVGSIVLRHQKRRSLFRISTSGRVQQVKTGPLVTSGQLVKNGQLVTGGQLVKNGQLVTSGQFFASPYLVDDYHAESMHDSLQKSNTTDANDITKQALGGWQWVDEMIVGEHSSPSSSFPPYPLLPPTKDSRTVVQDASSAHPPLSSVTPQSNGSAIFLIVVQSEDDDVVLVT